METGKFYINIEFLYDLNYEKPSSLVYGISKNALNYMTRYFANYLAPYIRVNMTVANYC